MVNMEKSEVEKSRKIFIPMAHSILSNIVMKLEDMERFKEFTISSIENEKRSVDLS